MEKNNEEVKNENYFPMTKENSGGCGESYRQMENLSSTPQVLWFVNKCSPVKSKDVYGILFSEL